MEFPPSNRRQSLAEMLNSELKLGNSSDTTQAATPPRRRQSMADMLRESALLGNTVSLVDAVESAQANAAKKAEALEASGSTAVQEAPPALAAPKPVIEVAPAPAPVIRELPMAVPVITAAPTASPTMLRYSLYARIAGRWTWQCELRATDHADGLRQAITWLKPEHNAYPIHLEQDEFLAA
jgi:hypothetical protein